ncbi:helix-turn-helix transcriptional regulator [Haliea alexandrii]|uniref:helix-turn-helix transcriptional regulator n=1 Tax=Haliea alexandrii TaxID=2448162 RepID=UPI000F0B2CC5
MQQTVNHSYNGSRRKRLLRLRGVQELTGLSRSYIYDLVNRGLLPPPVTLVPGGTSRAWVEDEILNFIDQRIAERDQEVGQ